MKIQLHFRPEHPDTPDGIYEVIREEPAKNKSNRERGGKYLTLSGLKRPQPFLVFEGHDFTRIG